MFKPLFVSPKVIYQQPSFVVINNAEKVSGGQSLLASTQNLLILLILKSSFNLTWYCYETVPFWLAI